MADERINPGDPGWRLYGLQHLQRYQFALERVRDRCVLDLACGVGYGSFVLSQTATSCLGIDLAPAAIAQARATYRRPNLSYRAGDALTPLAPDASFDAVVSFETIEHLPDPRAFLANLHRLLRPGGLLVISAPNALQFTRSARPRANEFHLSEPDHAEFVGWLEPAFEIREEWEQSPVLPALAQPAFAEWQREQVDRRLRVRRLAATPLRWLEAAERACRRALGKNLPFVPADEPDETVGYSLSAIYPLLPERRTTCAQFIFVCRRRDHPAASALP